MPSGALPTWLRDAASEYFAMALFVFVGCGSAAFNSSSANSVASLNDTHMISSTDGTLFLRDHHHI